MKLLALAGDIDALIADIRLRTPLQMLASRRGWSLQLRSLHDCTHADLAEADVLIVQRGMTRRAWRWMRRMRLQGGAVLYDIDDLLSALPEHVSNHAAVQARQSDLRRCLGQADVVTVSTERLGRALACPRWQVVPNGALDLDLELKTDPTPSAAGSAAVPVSLVFASMERLAGDVIVPALHALQAQMPGAFQIVVVGPAAGEFKAAGLQVLAVDLMPRAAFIRFVHGLPRPLAVIPLEDSLFASCKSAIKWMDYGAAGIPCLCSAVSPYADLVQHHVTGALVPNNAAAWQMAMAQAVGDAIWRCKVGAAARREVRSSHSLEKTVEGWQAAIHLARQHRQQNPPQAPGLLWSLQEVADAAAGGALRRLRRFNRDRLARRKAQGRHPR